jgi:hypothetical protein
MQAELVARTGRLERFLGREPEPARTEIDTSIRYNHAGLRTAYGKCSDRDEQVESHWRSLDPGGRLYRLELTGCIQPTIPAEAISGIGPDSPRRGPYSW